MKGRAFIALLLLGMVWAFPARAVMIQYNLERLSTGAEKIVIGEVVGLESRYLEPGRAIYTFVTISIEEVVKGAGIGRELVLRIPGGTVGDESMIVSHAPSFEMEERVLVFITRQVDGQDIVYNAENGKYTVEDGTVIEEGIPLENFLLAVRAYMGESSR